MDWQFFAQQVGFGIDRNDRYWAMLLAMFYNVNRGKDEPIKRPQDFLLYAEEYPDIDEEDFRNQILSLIP